MAQQATIEIPTLGKTASALLRALMYFDIFHYPLDRNEAVKYCPIHLNGQPTEHLLKELADNQLIYETDGYFSFQNTPTVVTQRKKGEETARAMLKKAFFISKFISFFPYVRAVCISGSLSKGCMDARGDIDYFVITRPGRLWICRTLLVLFKKIFLFNNKKYFCVNYFIDTEHLEIPDQNIFTATEVLTLVPTYNDRLFREFIGHNAWVSHFLPNLKARNGAQAHPEKKYLVKSWFETAIDLCWGNRLDRFLMRKTTAHWQRKFGHFDDEYFEHALRSRKYVSKHHPQNFQMRILQALEEKMKIFEDRHNVKLHRND